MAWLAAWASWRAIRSLASRRARSSSARRSSVMSRTDADSPVTAPDASRTGDTVSATGIGVPSLRAWSVLAVTARPARASVRIAVSSGSRSGGRRNDTWRPMASAAV